jgi:hypothetical protein
MAANTQRVDGSQQQAPQEMVASTGYIPPSVEEAGLLTAITGSSKTTGDID